MNLYTDSSSLLRRYLSRPGGAEFDEQFAAADKLCAAAISKVEVAASLTRLAAGNRSLRGPCRAAIRHLTSDLAFMWEVPISALVIQQAFDLAQRHLLKGYDAVQLGSASVWRSQIGEPVVLATFDDRLWKAAVQEKFVVWPPDLDAYK